MSIDNLPPLREVIERHDLMPKKSLGQNFLFDLNLTSKIARQAGNLADQPVIEVGPGPGGLTRALLAQGALVTAIERDERCLDALAEIEAYYPGRLRIISGDALEQDFRPCFPMGQSRASWRTCPIMSAHNYWSTGCSRSHGHLSIRP